MTAESWKQLQTMQHRHDETFHRDVATLRVDERLGHLALHFAKYVGRLARADIAAKDHKNKMRRTLSDTLLVALSASNVLRLDLDDRLEKMFGKVAKGDLGGWAKLIDTGAPATPDQMRAEWLNRLAAATGDMSLALDRHAHMMNAPARAMMDDAVTEIIVSTIIVGRHLGADLAKLAEERWKEIEAEGTP